MFDIIVTFDKMSIILALFELWFKDLISNFTHAVLADIIIERNLKENV